jgi:hypothetical protein
MITIYVDVWKAGFERLLAGLRNGFRADTETFPFLRSVKWPDHQS